jgi:hypothetical protein
MALINVKDYSLQIIINRTLKLFSKIKKTLKFSQRLISPFLFLTLRLVSK